MILLLFKKWYNWLALNISVFDTYYSLFLLELEEREVDDNNVTCNGGTDDLKTPKDSVNGPAQNIRQVSLGNLDDATLKARIATMGKGEFAFSFSKFSVWF